MRAFLRPVLLSALCSCGAPGPAPDGGSSPADARAVDVADDVAPAVRDAGTDARLVGLDVAGTDATRPPADGAVTATDGADAPAPRTPALPPVNAGLDYQLGGAYPPPAGVGVVSRDRTAAPAPGIYNVCYVNGFQIQPDETSLWTSAHPDLILRDAGGNPVIDVDWNEMLIDVSTAAKRAAVAAIVGGWIAACARSGFDAVEIDNLDSYSRSGGRLTAADAVATMRLFSAEAHRVGLAIAQKNSAELVPRRAEMGTDFAVSEECNRFTECDAYTAGYGDHVLVIEYRRDDFTRGCAAYPNLSIVLRDRNLVAPGAAGYVRDGC